MVRLLSFLALSLLLPVLRLDAKDTAGCMLHTVSFNHARLTQLTWTAEIKQYDSVPTSGHPFKIRIEFNEVGFAGSKGASHVGAMIQNVGHTFADDAFGRIGSFPGLGIYFS
jgi:hypothetical protein